MEGSHESSYISPPGKGTVTSVDTVTLARLARVSRNVSDAALDALWRSMHQPAPIIKLLPTDAYEAQGTRFRLKRPLMTKDFSVFDKYAPRIHYVDFTNSSKLLGPGCELFPYIKQFRNPVLPALEIFRWEPSTYNGSIGAFHLLSREASVPIREFMLLMWSEIERSEKEAGDPMLNKTVDTFNDPALWLPDVKKLTLRTLHYLPAVQAAIQNLTNLEHFSCDLQVSDALFEWLAVLPRLRSMDLRWLPASATASVSPDSPSFHALENLRISGTLLSIAVLLPFISSPNLLSVRLAVKDLESQTIDSSLLSLLLPSTIPSRTSTLLHFIFTGPPIYRGAAHLRLELAVFAPLYACTALQTFRVDVDPARLVLSDADVRTMAHAWPALTTLVLPPPHAAARPTSPVHLYTLWALATACPRLQQLALEVDADVSEAFHTEGGRGSGHAAVMEELTLYCSPCGRPALVADFLNAAFPRLPARVFHAYSTGQRPEDRERWAAVSAALRYVGQSDADGSLSDAKAGSILMAVPDTSVGIPAEFEIFVSQK
ncbi:hypothetical protein C8R47DRAFT_1125371 [Mycena vitilis]|nr:hypothetical protein C8R47DRAFT_1125371 [Mycena vitilis]